MLGQWFSCFTRVFSVFICHILESMLHIIHYFTLSSFTALLWFGYMGLRVNPLQKNFHSLELNQQISFT